MNRFATATLALAAILTLAPLAAAQSTATSKITDHTPVEVSDRGGPENDDVENATVITAAEVYESSTIGATSEEDEENASCTFGSPDDDSGFSVWWSYTPLTDGDLTLDTDGSMLPDGAGFTDTIVTIYQAGFEVECNDDDPNNEPDSGDFTSRIEDFGVDAGEEYLIRVSTYSGGGREEGQVLLAVTGPEGTPGGLSSEETSTVTTRLSQPSPNPVTSRAALNLTVGQAQRVTVAVYDLLGRRVADLFDGGLAAGQVLALAFEAEALPAGLYVIQARGEAFSETRRVTVVR
ncbi:MAG: T9SS type A sorting domain-containing protein [Bacteroidota bacterium]